MDSLKNLSEHLINSEYIGAKIAVTDIDNFIKIPLIHIAKFIYINGTAFLTATGKTRLMLFYTLFASFNIPHYVQK